MIVYEAELQAQAGLTLDAPEEDLALLNEKGRAAQDHIERLLGYKIADQFGEDVPPALREAVLQLACWWFENRETVNVGNIVTAVPFGVQDIVNEFRTWAF